MDSIVRWARGNVAVYFGNATAKRDYRVQLRGSRAVLLWGLYLVCLIVVALLTYSSVGSSESLRISEAQRALFTFYSVVMGMLAGMISLITPALAATTVVSERQRKSLDLVFSAPVTPKYYLVGKVISSFRYTWMLLILSLPVTASCVVLGGATWKDVLISYFVLSMCGLVFTCIALLMSTLTAKPAFAILYSYVAVGVYASLTTSIAMSTDILMRGPVNSRGEASFLTLTTPFTSSFVADTYTLLWGIQVPNWCLTALYTFLLCRFLLLGAASVLSPFDATDTKNLRISGLVYAGLLTYSAIFSYGISARGRFLGAEYPYWALTAALSMPIMVVIPLLSCFGQDAERKFRYDGLFRLRNIWRGTPSGQFPYLFLLLALMVAAMYLGEVIAGFPEAKLGDVLMAVWFLSFWLFFWSVGRFFSVKRLDLKSKRALTFATALGLLGLPVPFFAIVAQQTANADTDQLSPIWDLYLLRPLFPENFSATTTLVETAVLLAAAIGLLTYSESKTRLHSAESEAAAA